MKILIATYSAYPRVGGRSVYMKVLSEELARLGHQVDFIAHAPGISSIYHSSGRSLDKQAIRELIAPETEQRLKELFPGATEWIKWREIERYTFETAIRQFDLARYDIIHAQDLISARCLARVKPPQIPLVVTYHNMKSREWRQNDPRKPQIEMDYALREEQMSAAGADAVIFPCRWLRETFEPYRIPMDRARIIPYGIALPFTDGNAAPERQSLPVIACSARLVPIKGHAYLLEAFETLLNQGYRFQGWIIGDGVLRKPLEALCREKGLQHTVRFLGARNDVPELLHKSDIVVLPTLHDTFPFAVIEGQLAGKPVVASRIGGIPEMIESGKTGWLVEPGDSAELALALAGLLNSRHKRRDIGLAGKITAARRFSPRTMAIETLALYMQTIARQGSPSRRADDSVPDRELLEPLIRKWQGYIGPGQPEGQISGRVSVPESADGPSRAIVHLTDISWVTLRTEFTDEQGRFCFPRLPAGQYSLMISSPEYPPVSQYVEVEEGGSETSIEIKLSR